MKKALYLDADDTIWEVHPVGVASMCLPPYERIADNILKGRTDVFLFTEKFAENDCFIVLKEGARELIDWAKENDMDVVLVSSNDPAPVLKAVKELDLEFDRTYVGWFKDGKIDVIVKDMKKHGIDEAVFIDDHATVEVLHYCKEHPNECEYTPITKQPVLKNNIEVFDDIYDYIWEIYYEEILKEE